MNWNGKWIKSQEDFGDVVPLFSRDFAFDKEILSATLYITALGVYEASLNGSRISDYVFAPGWTSYKTRLQYQEYDVTSLLKAENHLEVLVGKGWYRGRFGWENSKVQKEYRKSPAGLIGQLEVQFKDGTNITITTDESWIAQESMIRFADFFDGEVYDATFLPKATFPVEVFEGPTNTLIPQQGEKIIEQEQLTVASVITTPKGETVIDFGQEVTGYIETSLIAEAGDIIDLSFGEVLDKEGNFYNDNYRGAKSQYRYICADGKQTYKPRLAFYGFRYVRINQFPDNAENVLEDCFTAIVVQSDIKRTGYLSCSNPLLNRLFDNIIWGQKCNFLDVPTDCPQRDERLGWTGDAQVFIRTASYNYNVKKFFKKWLDDLVADQHSDGYVGHIIPDLLQNEHASAAWGDAATICPWELYMAYGDTKILADQFSSMKGWVNYISTTTTTPNLWTGGTHYGDWLGLDAPSGSYKGSSREDFIASAYYAYSTSLVIKAGKILGKDITDYETLYKDILNAFRSKYPEYLTQTEYALAIYFNLAEDIQKAANQLAELIVKDGTKLQTGFVGTPYLLHALSSYGHTELAYSLLLRKDYPSWLYPVTKGATTVWEHWDSIMENGDFWSTDMNSFNHYAYGAVADWVYGVAAGIKPVEEAPGYKKVLIAPNPDARLDWLKASYESDYGVIHTEWKKIENMWRYEITTPVPARIVIAGKEYEKEPGTYYFYSPVLISSL